MKTLETVYFQAIGYRILSLLFSIFLFCICLQQLQWRHNEHNGVSKHQPLNFLLNRLCRRTSNKTSKRRWPVNSPHKGPVMRKMFPFDVDIMITEKKQLNGLLCHFQDMSGMTQRTIWKSLGMLHSILGYRILLYSVDLCLLATSQKKTDEWILWEVFFENCV